MAHLEGQTSQSGSVHDSAHLYQQATGTQYNADQMYFGELPPDLVTRASSISLDQWPTVAECDPLELGVHRAPISLGNAVPEYISRDQDYQIAELVSAALDAGGLIVLVGDSTAGKTRSAYEAVVGQAPDRHLVRPDSPTELQEIARCLAPNEQPPCILWLDDIERFLGPNGLTPGVAARLRRAKAPCIATIRNEHYRRLLRQQSDGDLHSVSDFRKLMDQSWTITLPRRWSATERGRAAESQDPRIRSALESDIIFGIAECLAAGPVLKQDWDLAWDAGANPRGASLVAAAVDCARAGVDSHVPEALLVDLHESYLEQAGGDVLEPEALDSALAWATRKRLGVASLLLRNSLNSDLKAFEYLPDVVARSASANPVHADVWQRLVRFALPNLDLLFGIAVSAGQQGQSSIEIECWTHIAEAEQDPKSFIILGGVLRGYGLSEEADSWYQRAADAGDLDGLTHRGLLAQDASEIDRAESFFLEAAEGGDSHGALHLAFILQNRSQFEEAERWYRRAHELREEYDTTEGLASVLMDRGQLEEAEALLRAAVDQGSNHPLNMLGIVLHRLGRTDEAESFWKSSLEHGSADSASNLARRLEEREDLAAAEIMWRKSLELGSKTALRNLAVCLDKMGRSDEAEALFYQAIDEQIPHSEHSFAIHWFNRKRYLESWDMAVRAAERDDEDGFAAYLASNASRHLSKHEDAEYWLSEAARRGHTEAQARLGQKLSELDDFTGAEPWLRLAAEGGDMQAACEYGFVCSRLERFDDAQQWLQKSLDSGHAHAGCRLGGLMLRKNDLHAAIDNYTIASDGGHVHAAEQLESLFRYLGEYKSAAYWRRVVQLQGKRPPKPDTRKNPRKKRPKRNR